MYDYKLPGCAFLAAEQGKGAAKMELTDLHCHILPGMDDGSPDFETSVAMAKMALAGGVHTIAATPHSNVEDDDMALRCRVICHRVAMLQDALSQSHVPVKILTGMELFIRDNLPEILESRSFMTLGGTKYLLGEFDFGEDGGYMDDALEYIKRWRLTPVLAHPERYAAVQHDPARVARWFNSGVIVLQRARAFRQRTAPCRRLGSASRLCAHNRQRRSRNGAPHSRYDGGCWLYFIGIFGRICKNTAVRKSRTHCGGEARAFPRRRLKKEVG